MIKVTVIYDNGEKEQIEIDKTLTPSLIYAIANECGIIDFIVLDSQTREFLLPKNFPLEKGEIEIKEIASGFVWLSGYVWFVK